MDPPEVAETFGKIAPRDARAIAIQQRFDKQTIVSGRRPDMAGAASKQVADAFPLIVPQGVASAHRSWLLLKPSHGIADSGD